MAGFSASSVALNGNTIDRWVWQEIRPGSSQRPATSTTSLSGSPAGGAAATCVTVPSGGLDGPAVMPLAGQHVDHVGVDEPGQGGPPPDLMWQAISRPSTGASRWSSSRQLSWASGQRGWNRQPAGGTGRVGHVTGQVGRQYAGPSTCGIAATSASV